MSSDRDRESVGLTPAGVAALAQLEQTGWFADGQDIARFALAYAIRAGVTEGSTPGTETRWAAGNFDKSGEIRSLLAGLFPDCATPVRQMEYLVDEGLRLLTERLASEGLGPADLVSPS
jgi:hypothetical protein